MGVLMLTPSRKIYYAIEAVLYIAYNAKALPVAGNAVAEAQGLPTRYLEPIMQKLVRAGILKGVRGPTGGYMLGRERRRISLADICAVITDATLPTCATSLGEKILRPATNGLIARWQEMLGSVTIADLCDQATAKNITTAAATPTDFTI
jgi:Rrf2 family protein